MAALVPRIALSNRSRNSGERSQEPAAPAKVTAARIVLSRSAASSVNCPPNEWPATAIRRESIPGTVFRKAKGHHIVELVGCQQDELQVLACVLSLGFLL